MTTKTTLETVTVLLAESDRSGRATPTFTLDQVRNAFEVVGKLERIARGLSRRAVDRCNIPLTAEQRAAFDRLDAKAAENVAALLTPYRIGYTVGGEPRGNQIHFLTLRTDRYNGMGGREDGWAV